jgi:hypothetical protein
MCRAGAPGEYFATTHLHGKTGLQPALQELLRTWISSA